VVRSNPINMGSKSEHVGYSIERPDGDKVRLYRVGDNPFTNAGLAPYEGQQVEVIGTLDGKVFIVREIRKID